MKKEIFISSILGFLSVALGAFGAHVLKDHLTETLIDTYNKAVLYHMVHSTILLFIAINGLVKYKISFYIFLLGILLFSFSLYLYAITSVKAFAFITPLGGLCLLAGWLSIIVIAVRKNN